MGDQKLSATNTEKPLVSIGMPVFNGETFIREAIDSILAQYYENFELIISDNASTDGTWEILGEYAKQDERIVLYRHNQNIGMMKNLRFVLTRARGKYFMWAAHDDLWDKNYVSELLKILMENNNYEVSCPKVIKILPDKSVLSTHEFPCLNGYGTIRRIRKTMFSVQGAWFYALFRTHKLSLVFDKVVSTGLTWACDPLLLLEFLLDQEIAGTNHTAFYQRKTYLSAKKYKPQSLPARIKFVSIIFGYTFRTLFKARLSLCQKLYFIPLLLLYLEYQVFVFHKRLKKNFDSFCQTLKGCCKIDSVL